MRITLRPRKKLVEEPAVSQEVQEGIEDAQEDIEESEEDSEDSEDIEDAEEDSEDAEEDSEDIEDDSEDIEDSEGIEEESEDIEDTEGIEEVIEDTEGIEEDEEECEDTEEKETKHIKEEDTEESKEETEKVSKKLKKKKDIKKKKLESIKIEIVSNKKQKPNPKPKPKSKKKKADTEDTESANEETDSSSSSEDESSSDEEFEPEEEYLEWVPKKIKKNPKQLHKVKGWILDIEDKTVTVEKLLSSKIRKKYKSEIFEWIMIYENSMPLSEERKALRKQIHDTLETYKKEYTDYKLHKKEIKKFEKQTKDFNELYDIQYKILRLETQQSNKEAIYRKYMELMDKSEEMNEEYYKLKTWIHMALQMPFDRIKHFPSYISISEYLIKVKQVFDQELYGMEKVKEQLLLFIHGKLVNPDIKGCCLGLVGEPGVGKTSIARCLATVMDFPFEQITFGGVNSAEFIRGFDYTYVGSRPGEISRCLTRMKYKNGILFFDEYEKISQNKDITACLLHITDFTQNNSFRDNYLHDLTIDLSSLWFIYSMNTLPQDEALKDRMFVIKVDGYNEAERVRILCDYLLPKHLKNLNLKPTDIVINDEISKYFIRKVCPTEKGIRTMEKYLKDLLSKTSFLVTNQQTLKCSFSLPSKYYPLQFPVTITQDMIDTLLKDALPASLSHLHMYI